MTRTRYRRKPDQFVIAIQLELETSGFDYQKWGGNQHCKAGDWLVRNGDDVYTVDKAVFERTYRGVGPGHYTKSTPIWAAKATEAGTVKTKEGSTDYGVGDYLVFNDEAGKDEYAIRQAKFESLYEPFPE
jgi:hypothetical protein